jgi:hypothetical protein
MIVKGLGEAVYNAYIQVTAGTFNFALSTPNLLKAILTFQWKIYVPLALSLAVTGYLIRVAYMKSGREVKHPGSLLFYFFAFFAFKAYFWSTAIFKELFRMSKAWT